MRTSKTTLRRLAAFTLILCLSGVSACGQKGPLKLPEETPAPTEQQ